MKYLVIVGDGMADYPVPELNNNTPLQAAYKPFMDSVAAKGRNGLLKTIPEGMSPGSDVAILSVLGFDPAKFYSGRGGIEASTRGIQLRENDVAFRCNLITEKGGILVDYSAGHINTKEAAKLIKEIKKIFEKPGEIEFYSGFDYRHFLILRKSPFALQIDLKPPHDVMGNEISEVLPKAKSLEAGKAATLLNEAIIKSKEI